MSELGMGSTVSNIIKSIYGRVRDGGHFFTDGAEEEVSRQVIWKGSWIQLWKKARQAESLGVGRSRD